MARNSKSTMKLIGITLIVVGIGLAIWGYQMSGSVGSQLSEAFSGAASDGVIIRYMAGAASFVAGLFIFSR
ncbi:MAG: DUF3185 family protein [Gammaproteobacteria bacterium]|nr:DUF3185 family protein [Gammaproteobacteria bacterium]